MNPDPFVRSMRPEAIVTKFVLGAVGERQIRVVATDATPDRDGDIVEPQGAVLDNFKKNPVCLWQHNAAAPIARCSSIGPVGAQLIAVMDFPPPGTSNLSDECLRLAKAGIVSAVSIGFLPLQWAPLAKGGFRFIRWELLELSLCSVPSNPDALVIGRSMRGPVQRREMSRSERMVQAARIVIDVVPLIIPACETEEEYRRVLDRRREAERFLRQSWS